MKDAGPRKLPRTPPAVTVDADGRRYTVRYHNRLPKLVLRWPAAPAASSYTVQWTREGGATRTRTSTTPSIALRSGELPEGAHRFRFSAGGRSSKQGLVRIAFDNTARTAYLSEPRDGAVPTGGTVRVAGAALQRSRVRVGDARLSLRDQGRFGAEVSVPADQDAISVRVQHRSTGIHYYVRHTRPGAL